MGSKLWMKCGWVRDVLLKACSSRNGVIGVDVMGGLDSDNIADQASTCYHTNQLIRILCRDSLLVLTFSLTSSTISEKSVWGRSAPLQDILTV